jgi:hypothetical protein
LGVGVCRGAGVGTAGGLFWGAGQARGSRWAAGLRVAITVGGGLPRLVLAEG